MAEITIISSVQLYKKGIETIQADGKIKSIALHQGSIDGACAVYSTIIALMCLRQINYEDVYSGNGNVDKRSPKGKFLSKLLEQRGMNMRGWNLKTMSQEINNTTDFSICSTAVRKDFVNRIYNNVSNGLPSIVGITYTTGDRHAIVCIGIEYNESEDKSTKLFCIDPGYTISFTSYWNCIILIPSKYNDQNDFTYVVEDQICKIKLDDAIVFN